MLPDTIYVRSNEDVLAPGGSSHRTVSDYQVSTVIDDVDKLAIPKKGEVEVGEYKLVKRYSVCMKPVATLSSEVK